MTLTARLAKIEAAIPAEEAEPPNHFGLTPEEFHRQCGVLTPLFAYWFGDTPAPECPEGVHPELHRTFVEICLTV